MELKKTAFQASICLGVSRVLESRSEIYEKILNCKSPMLDRRRFTNSKSRQKRIIKKKKYRTSVLGFLYYLKEGNCSGVKTLVLLWVFQQGRSCSYTCKLTSPWLQGLGELFYWWMIDKWVSRKCSRNCSWYPGINVYENTLLSLELE